MNSRETREAVGQLAAVMPGSLLTARQVADRYGHHPETILRWHRQGKMDGVASYTPGGQLRFRADRLEELEEQWATTSRGASPAPLAAAHPVGYASSPVPIREED